MTRRPAKAALRAALLAVLLPGCSHIPRTDPDYARRGFSAASASGPSSAVVPFSAPSSAPSFTAGWQSLLTEASLRVVVEDPTAAHAVYVPKSEAETRAKVLDWLQGSAPYTGWLPPLDGHGMFYTNTASTSLTIDAGPDGTAVLRPVLVMMPEEENCPVPYQKPFVPGALECRQGNQTRYLACPPLCDWLKTNGWKSECAFSEGETGPLPSVS